MKRIHTYIFNYTLKKKVFFLLLTVYWPFMMFRDKVSQVGKVVRCICLLDHPIPNTKVGCQDTGHLDEAKYMNLKTDDQDPDTKKKSDIWYNQGCIKFLSSPWYKECWGEYQVVKKRGEYQGCGEGYNVKKGKGEAISSSLLY